jgi:hypothetical protein
MPLSFISFPARAARANSNRLQRPDWENHHKHGFTTSEKAEAQTVKQPVALFIRYIRVIMQRMNSRDSIYRVNLSGYSEKQPVAKFMQIIVDIPVDFHKVLPR